MGRGPSENELNAGRRVPERVMSPKRCSVFED